MEVTEQHLLQINIVDEEVGTFKSIFKTLITEVKKAGFKKMFTTEEGELIKEINDKINNKDV